MAEGDITSGGEPGGRERDILAERRARREQGDGALVRRAQDAEATVRTLEAHIAELRGRLREAEEEQRRTAEQLAEREQEVRRVKQREYAEQQLRVEVEEQRERLEREQRAEVDRLQRRLTAGERHARELTDRLESLRRELAEAEQSASAEHAAMRRSERELAEREADLNGRELALERTRAEIEQRLGEARTAERDARDAQERDEQQLQTLTARLATLERQAAELRREMALEREARERSERELQGAREGHARMERIVHELKDIAVQLRASMKPPGPLAPLPGASPQSPIASQGFAAPERTAQEEEDHRLEMAKALAAAVERLRTRVKAADELQSEPHVESEPVPPAEQAPVSASMPFTPRVLTQLAERRLWLAPAIRRVAERHDAKLAGELVCELLAAQGTLLERPLTYTLRIEELGDVQVQIERGRATVRRLASAANGHLSTKERGAFMLEGPAAEFAELAAGGTKRRLTGVRVRGSRRQLRRLLAARRPPLEFSTLVEADIRLWPGLMLLAISEAVPPEWTVGYNLILAFVIEGAPNATIYVQIRDGAQITVTRVRSERPLSTIRLSERTFLRMLSGGMLPAGEQVLVEGPTEPLQLLLGWSDRIQGLVR